MKNETQKSITQWARETHNTGDPRRVVHRANLEMAELLYAIGYEMDQEKVKSELADMFILLSQVAELSGWCVQEIVNEKMKINRNRAWAPGSDGRGQHL